MKLTALVFEFSGSVDIYFIDWYIFQYEGQSAEQHSERCSSVASCPKKCSCTSGVVDCRSASLTEFPSIFPDDVTEM